MTHALILKFRAEWRRHRATALVLVIAALGLAQASGPSVIATLRYDRAAVAAGEWWRLLTGQFVHLDATHLAMNVAALVLLWCLYVGDAKPRQWLLIALGALLGVGLGLQFLEPGVEWYVGLSGALHGLWAGGGIAARKRWPLESSVTLALLAAKLVLEAWHGPVSGLLGVSLPVVTAAHRYGALSGAAVALALRLWRRPL